jgi:hypothetical protein
MVVTARIAPLLGVLVVFMLATPASAQPMVTLTPGAAAPLSYVYVQLDGWPAGTATISTCGNSGLRGSPDCDLVGSETTAVPKRGSTTVQFFVRQPPVLCPCVVRVSTATSDLVRMVPINLIGVPNGAEIPPNPAKPTSADLLVSAKVRDRDRQWPGSWAPAFGGPTRRVLALSLHNRGAKTLTHLRVVGSVGKGSSSGEPLPMRIVGSLAPGATKTITVPVDIAAPVWGRYAVKGRVYGADAAVPFSTSTSNDPWALELLIPVALLVVAQIARRRERAERGRESSVQVPGEAAPELFEGSSLPVGEVDEPRSQWSPYDPLGMHVPVAHGNPPAELADSRLVRR